VTSTTPAEAQSAFDRALRAERLRLHAQVLPLALLGSTVLALVVAVTLWGRISASLVLGWVLCVAVAIVMRALVHLAQPPADAGDEAASRSLRRHRAAYAVHGLAWMLGGLLMWAPGAGGLADLIAFAAAAVVGGALISGAFDIVAVAWFAAPAAAPLLVHQLQRHGGAPTAGDLIAALFVVTVTVAAVRNQRGTRRAVAAQLAAAQRAEESRRTAELLADKHRLLEQLLRTARQGFWFVDAAGITTDLNPEMCEMLGRSREMVVGRSIGEFLAPQALAAWQAQCEAAIRSGPTEVLPGCEIEIVRSDDSVVTGWVTAATLNDASGRHTGSVGIWADISARRADEAKLRTYEVVANSISDLVSVVDEKGVYRLVNDAWCRASGMSREQVVGATLDAVPVPGAADERRRALRECLERHEVRQVRSALDLPGFVRRYVETTFFPYADAIAGMRCAVLVSRDITEPERARAALAETAAYLDRTLNATGEAIFASDATDTNQLVRFCNEQMLRMFGIPLEMAGKISHAVLAKYLRPLLVDPDGQARLVAEVVAKNAYHESQVRLKDGRVLFQRCIPSKAGEKPLRVWSFRDITAELRALEAAQARDAEQRALLEAFPGFIARLDDQLRYTFANDRMLALMGLPREAVIGRTVLELPGLTHPEAAHECHLRALAGEVVVIERHYPARPHRPATDMQIIYAPGADHAGGKRVVYAFANDITPLKRTEAALLAAKEEAERANRAKSQFLSQMSHELRTPLNAILGFGQLLEAAREPGLPPKLRPYTAEILRGARHLLELINEVLDLGSIEAGRLQMRPEPVDLCELCDECLSLVRPLAAEREVQLPPPCALVDLCQVLADRTRLKQVLLNLLANAIKYNRRGGHVAVAARMAGERVRFEVQDSGPGLDPEQQRRLFEPFERLGADRGDVEGTGIGLALSRGLMEAMNGEIGVVSERGKGSTFWLELPRAVTDDESLPGPTDSQPTTPAPAEAPRTVLYIEDNQINATLMQAMLERLPGVAVKLASDGQQGLEQIARDPPALVLSDIQLPGIDGIEVLRRLRANPATRAIPVVAVSANAMPADIAAGLAAGFDDYLAKPIDLKTLHQTVARLLRKGPAGG